VHGLIFASFRDYLLTEHGPEVAHAVTAGEPQYTLGEAYPDEQFLALLERACERTSLPLDELLFEFGVFTAATTFARLYSVLFRSSPTARDFLLTVETPIHEVIHVSLPDARPPELEVVDRGEDGLEIVYTSPRRICAMLRGLVEGTGRVYGETLEVEEPECMHRGAPACRVVVRSPSVLESAATIPPRKGAR
jgi:predicted hydrocarbon binding protein